MAQINVSITGASHDARLLWDAQPRALTKAGNNYSASFQADAGIHIYVVSMAGAPGQKWTVEVTGGNDDFEHEGHMSPGGIDTTGDTPYKVS
jgi:hypothetical protein